MAEVRTSSCCSPAAQETCCEPEAKSECCGAADGSCGCGNPAAVAEPHPGETVLDLGSGGGIDVLLSARRVGPEGEARGLDMTDEMLEPARPNRRAAGAEDVKLLKGPDMGEATRRDVEQWTAPA